MILVLAIVPIDKAEAIRNIVLEKKLCACVNIVKEVNSFFWWKGKIDNEKESLLLIKTKDLLFSALEKEIKINHPYEVPEIIAFKADYANREYLDWLNKETNGL